ncbi:MAG: type II toxin-antitoxin system VapC family toxin [Candidatus Obscuribacterales bacterium]|nr:type II toxin-antitoxin system VapC family toxin [Candidatus Obscuribacterales bacterium]
MRIALDTNRYVDFMKNDLATSALIRRASEIYMPLIVLAELRAGFAYGSKAKENEQRLVRFLNSARVQVLCPDEGTTFVYAQLYAQLKKQGTPIPSNDLWVAALVVQHDLILCARDKHFDFLPQIPRA